MGPVALTALLAGVTTLCLMAFAVPAAWWLAQTRSWAKAPLEAITAMPLVLPPTVLGFYLLLLFSPNAPLGGLYVTLTDQTLSFSFTGLVIASMLYSLPFAVQPLQSAFEALPRATLETAATLGAGPVSRFVHVGLPLSTRGLLTAAVLTFAHTVGEFGVVLMVGGNLPGETRVISIAIFEAVETLDYAQAHRLSLLMVAFSFITLLVIYSLNRRTALRG